MSVTIQSGRGLKLPIGFARPPGAYVGFENYSELGGSFVPSFERSLYVDTKPRLRGRTDEACKLRSSYRKEVDLSAEWAQGGPGARTQSWSHSNFPHIRHISLGTRNLIHYHFFSNTDRFLGS